MSLRVSLTWELAKHRVNTWRMLHSTPVNRRGNVVCRDSPVCGGQRAARSCHRDTALPPPCSSSGSDLASTEAQTPEIGIQPHCQHLPTETQVKWIIKWCVGVRVWTIPVCLSTGIRGFLTVQNHAVSCHNLPWSLSPLFPPQLQFPAHRRKELGIPETTGRCMFPSIRRMPGIFLLK